VQVDLSSTVNISNSCFVNNYINNQGGPVYINSDSGLVASTNNYISKTPLDVYGDEITPCQYIFLVEAYKCVAPDCNGCALPACAASYKLYDARKNKVFANIENGGIIASPPCNVNIEVVLRCATTGKNVTVQLLIQNGTVAVTNELLVPFFVFGNVTQTSKKPNIADGKNTAGTYTIQAIENGVVQPSPVTFTLNQCLP
jgi:hypothetical protein